MENPASDSLGDRIRSVRRTQMTTRSNLHTALCAMLGSFLLLSTTAFAQKVEPTPENIGKGEAIFKKHCQMCHGATGMGDGPAGKRLNPKPYNFQDKEKMAALTDEQLFKVIT